MNLTKKLRMAEDCRSCFLHAANPVYDNRRRWGEAEKAILKVGLVQPRFQLLFAKRFKK